MKEPGNALYLLLCLLLVGSSLVAMRMPLGKALKMAAAWVALFAAAFALFAFGDEWRTLGARLKDAALGAPAAVAGPGGEVRVAMSEDGHYWLRAEVNGTSARFLVDSGASLTTVGSDLAQGAGVEPEPIRVAQVKTANGQVIMQRGRIGQLRVGPVVRDDFPVLIAPQDGLNVLGMNFLSSLRSWRSEDGVLVLIP